MVQLDEKDLSRLREQITEYSGLDASVLSEDALRQAVAWRLAAHALQRPDQYWPLILGRGKGTRPTESDEIAQLVQILTNKETFFFREGHHFEALHTEVLPALLAPDPELKAAPGRRQAGSGRRLRVWSAGCATGEEPYSLAIALLEYRARHGFFEAEIVATDIDEVALQVARRGCYGQRSLRLVPEEARRRYFRSQARGEEEQGYCVLPEPAELVTFRRHNLADENPPPGLSDFDLIFCRNVSIYFHPAARQRLNARLAAALRPGGYLFVASAETMGHNQGRLDLVSLGNTFLFRKPTPGAGAAPRTVSLPTQKSPPAPGRGPGVLRDPVGEVTAAPARRAGAATGPEAVPETAAAESSRPELNPLVEAVRAFTRQEFEAALRHLDRIADVEQERLDVRCLRAAIFLQREQLQEAERLCQEVLARDPWHADAHFMLGLTYRQRGQTDAAIQSLKQAIYLHPGHRDAHFFLAEIYRGLELEADARREYENTLNILAASGEPSGSPGPRPEGARLHLTGLTDEAVRHACQANLRRLHPPRRSKRWKAAERRQ